MDASRSNGADHVSLGAVHRVAYAIGRVIAEKTVKADPALRRLDGIGRASAVHTMATNMTNELLAEATAAYAEAVKIQHEDREAAHG